MIVETSELHGMSLDWAVAKCEGANDAELILLFSEQYKSSSWKTMFSGSWALAGPIIEREKIWLAGPYKERTEWYADASDPSRAYGPTPLVAAMRCYVLSKMGDSIDVPDAIANK